MTATELIGGLLVLVVASGGFALIAFAIADGIRNRRVHRARAERLRWSI
jgi:hypothetical protein